MLRKLYKNERISKAFLKQPETDKTLELRLPAQKPRGKTRAFAGAIVLQLSAQALFFTKINQ
jgi:hypothetical protein